MGCFDTVRLNCPACGAPIELTSKAGACRLHTWAARWVPVEVAVDLEKHAGTVVCPGCSRELHVETDAPLLARTRLEPGPAHEVEPLDPDDHTPEVRFRPRRR